jgi:hypothetical protein
VESIGMKSQAILLKNRSFGFQKLKTGYKHGQCGDLISLIFLPEERKLRQNTNAFYILLSAIRISCKFQPRLI